MNTSELLHTKVKRIMTTELVTVTEGTTLAVVDTLMKSHNIHHIPIVDDLNNLKGILTKNDVELLKDWGTTLNLKSSISLNKKILNSQKANERMNDDIVWVKPDDNLEKCVKIFKSNRFHALPVKEGKKLVGIITTMDLLNHAYNS